MIDYSVRPERPQRPIAAEPFHRYVFDDGTVWTEFYRTAEGYLLRFPDLAGFEVTADGKIAVRCHCKQVGDSPGIIAFAKLN